METKNPKRQVKQALDSNIRKWLIYYIDTVTRGLIALVIMLIIIFGLKNAVPSIPNWYFLPVAFIISLILTPFLSKIKIGHIFADRYIQLLNNIVYKLNKGRINNG